MSLIKKTNKLTKSLIYFKLLYRFIQKVILKNCKSIYSEDLKNDLTSYIKNLPNLFIKANKYSINVALKISIKKNEFTKTISLLEKII